MRATSPHLSRALLTRLQRSARVRIRSWMPAWIRAKPRATWAESATYPSLACSGASSRNASSARNSPRLIDCLPKIPPLFTY
eukprot:1905806-Pyramimonas_sp.AAC.1